MIRKLGTFVSNNQKFLPLTATIFLFFSVYAVGAFFYDGMREPQVFVNLFRTSPFLLISAIGMTMVIISGGIDLSVSGVIALTTVASAALLRTGNFNPWVVMLLMLLMGMSFGAVMGFFITYLKVQPFIATLAGMWFARGLCFFISDDAISINNRIYRILGQTKLLIPGLSDPVTQTGVYISILVVLEMLVLGVAIYVMHFTRFGRTLYAMGYNNGANEQSALLMGLPVNRTKMLVYIANGFCSGLAGIAMSIYVMSGHGLYATGFEMTVIAAVVIGGIMLTGGEGYMFGTLFGVLITGVIQTLIQFNGKLSSWWTNIVVGLLTLVFIGVQSLLAARKTRQAMRKELLAGSETAQGRLAKGSAATRRLTWIGGGALVVVLVAVIALAVWAARGGPKATLGSSAETPTVSSACQFKPYRQDQAGSLVEGGAVIAYERNGGSTCIDELYSFYADGRILVDDGTTQSELKAEPAEIEQLLAAINARGWFSENMYDTWHTPCGQCFGYYVTVTFEGQTRTVKAVDGGTDAPADYWQVISSINGVIQKLTKE